MAIDKEILDDFRKESAQLLGELEKVVSDLEDNDGKEFPEEQLKEFSQKIDRIMGAAKTILVMDPGHEGISFLANISEMCKTMGYQAAALRKTALVPIFAGFWAETVETMLEILKHIDASAPTRELIQSSSAVIQKRLAWLAERVAPDGDEQKAKVVALLKKL